MSPPEELLPVLVADLADDESKDVLEAAAATGGRVYVPLAFAPVSASVHVLEAKLPSVGAPLLFLAEPLGPPTRDGFPLRIRTFGASTPKKPSTVPPANGVVRGKGVVSAPPTLSASHTRDLSHVGPMPRDPDEDPLVGRALAGGKLKIEALIGRGGAGAVYKAIHRELKIPVAVKCLHESFQHDIDFCRRFYAEALAASRLDHPNLTRVIDFGQEPDGLLYLAMEYLAGVELRTVLEEARVFPTQRALEIVVQVCAAMSHAHARGVVHRDLKPENIMLVSGHDDDGEPIEMVKVCDFGIAQHRAIQGNADGTVAGTPEYMSPEQCRGEELDARSDVYALGVILYELTTGQVPFIGDKALAVMQRQQKSAPLPMSRVRPEVEPRLEPIVQKALQKDPRHRQQTMRELRADLRELLSGDASPPPASVSSTSLAAAQPYPSSARMPAVPPPLPAKKPPPPVPSPPQPDWLERGGAYAPPSRAGAGLSSQGQEVRRTTSNVESAIVLDEVADQLQVDAAGWMTRFARTPDPRAFAQIAQRLEPAIRALAARGDTSTMWTVSSALHAIASEGSQAVGSRAQIAGRVVRVFEDPTLLGVVGEAALVAGDGQRDFGRRLLVNAGVGGAYGLYAARVKLAGDPAVRPAFVALLKDFGVKAWPVVRAALEKILNARGLEGETSRATAELAEDLLLCVPFVGDEAAGHLVVKYLRASLPGPVRAATAAIAKLWGERAKPLFVGMLQAKDDVVRIAGIAGLRQLDAIDEHVVPRLHAILIRRVETSEETRAAAALALAYATPSAHTPAISLLAAIVRGPIGAAPSMPRLPTGPAMAPVRIPTSQHRIAEAAAGTEDSVVHAAARSLLVVGGSAYRTVLAERAERAGEPLRSQLRKLLMAEGS